MVALRQHEDLQLPLVDSSLSNTKLLPQLCHLLLQKCGTLVAQGCQRPPPPCATLTRGMYADGYERRHRPNVNTKLTVIDFDVLWFPSFGSVPRCTYMIIFKLGWSCPKLFMASGYPNGRSPCKKVLLYI